MPDIQWVDDGSAYGAAIDMDKAREVFNAPPPPIPVKEQAVIMKVIAKSMQKPVLSSRKDAAMKTFDDIESELGRLGKLVKQARAEFLRSLD